MVMVMRICVPGPVLDLGEGRIVFGGRQVVREDETSKWVPELVNRC